MKKVKASDMKVYKEFKEFAVKGNVVDLAIAVIIGGAFGRIVTSLVNDVILPPLGLVLGGVKFSELKIVMKAAQDNAGAVTINYGLFLETVLDFLIIAAIMFVIVKAMNALKRKAEDPENPEMPTPKEIQLLSEIRDLLKKGGQKP